MSNAIHTIRIAVVAIALLTAVAACAEDAEEEGTTTTDADDGTVVVTSEFVGGSDGWASDIADYTDETRPDDVLSETGVSPPGLDAGDDMFHVAVSNPSDDIFLYLRRHVTMDAGLVADMAYRVDVDVRFASNAPSGCAGIGGAPGESVWMKAGAASSEPVPVSRDGDVRLGVDKGGQSQAGSDAVVLGTIENGIPCEEALEDGAPPYALVTLSGSMPRSVSTGHDGTLWLFVGTDSGFEGRTSVYYDRVDVTLTPAPE